MADAGAAVRHRWLLRPLSFGVLVVILGASIAGAFAVQGVVHDQETRLLKQRTEEVRLLLNTIVQKGASVLGVVGGSVFANPNDTLAFRSAAQAAQRTDPQILAVALVRTDPTPTVVQAVRSGFPGLPRDNLGLGPLDSERAAAVRAAVASNEALQKSTEIDITAKLAGVVRTTSLMPISSRASVLGGALAGPGLPPGYVVYQEQFFPHPATVASRSAGDAFDEVDAAVYAVGEPDTDQLVLTTVPVGKLPLSGLVDSQVVSIGGGPGGSSWLLEVKPRQPLAGSVAHAVPWLIALSGALVALLVATVVEVLARRRRYAVELVEERTAELRRSLDELAAAQEQLVRQERLAAIGELASAIGHELRNPLGVLSNALYLLRANLGDSSNERLLRQLATADREVSAATLIVSDLLDYSRGREPIPSTFELDALVDEVLSVAPAPDGIAVERPSSGTTPQTVSADRDQVRQVLLNLVTNAYQAMPEGGTLRIESGLREGGVQVVVADNGMGMDEEVRQRVFEPFYTTKARGVGLGLAVSQRIAAAHGGRLEVESTPGAGTTFTLTLPTVVVPRPPADDRQAVAQ